MKIGVDLDDTISYTRPEILKFHNENHGTHFTIKDLKKYNFWEIWGGPKEATVQEVEDFQKTEGFRKVKPREEALSVLKKLKENNELFVITARRDNIRKETEEWVEKYFPNIFSQVYFTNHLASENSTTKKKVCDDLGIDIFIEDHLENALDCAKGERKVYLFDYPWNQTDELPSNIKRITSWNEIEI